MRCWNITRRVLLKHGERRRQCAGTQQNGEIVGLLHGEISADQPRAAKDRFADHGHGHHLVIEHDSEWLVDILLCGFRQFTRSARIKAEADERLVCARI